MNRKELKDELLIHGVPEISFSVDGIKDGECMCIVNDGGRWKVVYNSRGKIVNIADFEEEEEACDFMYGEMKQEYGWK